MTAQQPSIGKAALALGGAAIAATAAAVAVGYLLALIAIGPPYFAMLLPVAAIWGVLIALPIALLHAGLLGLPLYLLVRRAGGVHRWSAALGGTIVGLAPLLVLMACGFGGRTMPAAIGSGWPGLLVFGLSGLTGGLFFHHLLERAGAQACTA